MNALCRFATVLTLTLIPFCMNAKAKVRFGIAAEPYPPFTWKDATGQWVGWEVDMMNAVCTQMNEKCSIVEVSWDGIIASLNGHFFDVIWSSMGVTKARLKEIDFTEVYYSTPIVMIGVKNSDMDLSPIHLAGKIIGVQSGTMHERYVDKYFASKSVIKRYQTQDEANEDLVAGRVDYVEIDALPGDSFLKTDAGGACCELKGIVPGDPEIFGGLGVAGGVRKDDDALKDRLNAAITAVRTSGECDAISRKYFTLHVCGD
jgi:polar amino acid transport system substrate-binding protein